MTIEELESAIRAGDQQRCLALLRAALEPERRAAAPMARKWHSAAWTRHLGEDAPAGVELPKQVERLEKVVEAAAVSMAGTATLTELKALGWRAWHLPEPAWSLIAERRPEWLQGWADWVVEQNIQSWVYVRRLIRSGAISPPAGDGYITALIGCTRDALALLREDPELLEREVWQLFEVEGGGENSLSARDKFNRGEGSWSHALRTLSAEGRLSRERLLDASLDALQRDFGQFRVAWFSSFHEALTPTLDERAARADRYLQLLGSPIPPTVSFALKALAVLDKGGQLPAAAFVGHVAPALGAREKGTVTLALKLLEKVGKHDAVLAEPVTHVACEALLHERPDVQEAALNLIERLGRKDDPVLGELLRGRLEDLAPSQRPRAAAWVGAATPSEPRAAPAAAPSAPREELSARVAAIAPPFRELASLDAALADIAAGELSAPPVDLRDSRIPRLDPDARLRPVEDLDELIELLSMLLENHGPPDEIERALDGLTRLADERPADFDQRTAPLKKRAAALLKRLEADAFQGWLPRDLPLAVTAWLTGTVAERARVPARDLTYFYGNRLLEVSRCAAARQPTVLLGAPTHAGGWIDPRVLVERVRRRPDGAELLLADAIQALLRLAPDHRAAALADASALPGELGDALRHALGAEGIPVGKTRPLWVAAARARDPLAADPAVLAAFPRLGPGAAAEAAASLDVKRRIFKDRSREITTFQVRLAVEPALPTRVEPNLPTVLLYDTEYDTDLNTRRWLAQLWPWGREAWFAEGAGLIGNNLDWWEAEWDNRVFLETLLEPDTHLGPMGMTLLGLGLAAKEPGESGLATDGLIAAAADGRVTGEKLGDALARLLSLGLDATGAKPGGFITGTRWARTLADAARSGPLAAEVVSAALQRVLSRQPSLKPADLAALLELLHELSVQLGAAITDAEARRYLESQRGSGKGGKLAQSLLALTENGHAEHRRVAANEALEGRIQRAERWGRMSN
ncbi:MAG: hypothetical protein K0Q72_754 [Armatimonadetes bacterium]|nr:hypothetical protein [Armatimonadota bacterium]